jgi:HAD superfamily hydrolase (TIGR01509 family)
LLGAVKPDPQVFKTILRESGLEAGDIHFLDDSTTNVRAAERLGMHAFRADGLREAERILQSEGLLSS